MAIHGMNHFTILTADLEATRRFYIDILGLRQGWRPDLGFPGMWLYTGDKAVLHVIAGRPMPKDPAGVLDHMAFTASGLVEVVSKLKAYNIRYDLRRQAEARTWQLFCHDPSGARVELDFDPSEPAPDD